MNVTCKFKDGYKYYVYGQGQISRPHVRPRTDIKFSVRSRTDINVTCTAKDKCDGYI